MQLSDFCSRPRTLRARTNLLLRACATFAFGCPAPALFAQSASDGFNVSVDGPVVDSAVQADGKILLAGYFSTVNGEARPHLVRLFVDGSIDTGFANLDHDVGVTRLLVLDDGSIIVGGEFTHFGDCSCARLVRLHADGVVDSTFHPDPDAAISAIARQRDGRFLIGGDFTHLGASTHHYIARINKDGSVDESYPPADNDPDQRVAAIVPLPDGKALIAGAFTMIGAQSVSRLARLRNDGSVDSTFTPAKPIDQPIYAMALRLDRKIVIGGAFATVGVDSRPYLARLNADGSLDSAYPAPDGFVYALAQQSDGKLLAGGNFFLVGAAQANKIARFNADNSFDAGFRPPYTSNAYITSSVRTFAVQPDGRVVAGGAYTPFDGNNRAVGRLNADGSLDVDFPAALITGNVRSLSQQPDGKTLVGVAFPNPFVSQYLWRVKADGSNDAFAGFIVNGDVRGIALQRDGKFILGGNFDIAGDVYPRHAPARFSRQGDLDDGFIDPVALPGAAAFAALDANERIVIFEGFGNVLGFAREGIARLNDDGGIDLAFVGPHFSDAFTNIYAVSPRPDGKVVIGGSFQVAGVPRFIALLNSDGTLDPAFDKAAPNSTVTGIIRQPDGKTLISGFFTVVANQGVPYVRHGIARLNADGSLDASLFDTEAEPGGYVSGMALQADGRIVVVGAFGSINFEPRDGIARLEDDGTLDPQFSDGGGADGQPAVVALPQDGRPIVGGAFVNVGGAQHRYLARLATRDAALQSLRVDPANTSVTWLRGGASPELSLPPRLQISHDAVNFGTLGTMTRIEGGWRSAIPAQPFGTIYYLRAVGPVSNGVNTGWIESVVQATANEFIFADGFD